MGKRIKELEQVHEQRRDRNMAKAQEKTKPKERRGEGAQLWALFVQCKLNNMRLKITF